MVKDMTNGSQKKKLEMWIIVEKMYSILWVDKEIYIKASFRYYFFSFYTGKRKFNIWWVFNQTDIFIDCQCKYIVVQSQWNTVQQYVATVF